MPDGLSNQPPAAAPLDPDALLMAEYNYIAETAFQANEDRARVTSFYVVSVGSFIAAIISTQLLTSPARPIFMAFSGLFLLLSVLAVLTLLQIARLRKAWHESAAAMNQIKDFYIQHTGNPPIGQALRWTSGSLPRRFKRNSISSYLAIEVALVGAVTIGAAVFFWQSAGGNVVWPAFPAGALFFCLQIYIYWRSVQ